MTTTVITIYYSLNVFKYICFVVLSIIFDYLSCWKNIDVIIILTFKNLFLRKGPGSSTQIYNLTD